MDKSNDKNGPQKSRFPRVHSSQSIPEGQVNGKIARRLEFNAKKRELQLKNVELTFGNMIQFSNNGKNHAAVAAISERKPEAKAAPVLSDEQPVVLPGVWKIGRASCRERV